MLLTVTNAVLFAAVVAGELSLLSLAGGLRAGCGPVTILIAVVAAHLSAVDGITCVVQASEDVIIGLGPTLTLAGATRLFGETNGNRVGLADVSLEVHVGEGAGERTLQSNEPELSLGNVETQLNVLVGGRTIVSLDILLDRILGVVDIALLSSLEDVVPSSLRSKVLDMISVDLTRSRALGANMTLYQRVST